MLPVFRSVHSARRLASSRVVPPHDGARPEHGPRARYANMALGLWLFVSAFIWPHTMATRLNTCIVGVLVIVAATMATGIGLLRQLTGVLALWLLLTTALVYPASHITFWNNILVACGVLALSRIPNESERGARDL